MHLFILTLFIIILGFITVLLFMLVCGHGDKAVKLNITLQIKSYQVVVFFIL